MSECNQCKRPNAPATNKQAASFKDDDSCLFRMEDGRMFTDYSNRCAEHAYLKNQHQLTSHQMREWYIKNGEKIMEESRQMAIMNGACKSCIPKGVQGTMLPELNRTKCNANYCEFSTNDNNGLGLGVTYN